MCNNACLTPHNSALDCASAINMKSVLCLMGMPDSCGRLSYYVSLVALLGLSGESRESPSTTNLLLMDLKRVAVGHFELHKC